MTTITAEQAFEIVRWLIVALLTIALFHVFLYTGTRMVALAWFRTKMEYKTKRLQAYLAFQSHQEKAQ